MDPRVAQWLHAFLLTVLLETPVVVYALRREEPKLRRRLALALLANLLTHPAVWFIFPFLGLHGSLALALSEAWAVLLETWLYALAVPNVRVGQAFATAMAANAFSYVVGLAMRPLLAS